MYKFYPLTERTVEKVAIPSSHDEPPDLGSALCLLTVYLTSESLSECAVCPSKDPGYHFPLMPRTKILELLREHFAPTNDQILKPQVIDLVPLTPGWSSLFLPFPMRFVQ